MDFYLANLRNKFLNVIQIKGVVGIRWLQNVAVKFLVYLTDLLSCC